MFFFAIVDCCPSVLHVAHMLKTKVGLATGMAQGLESDLGLMAQVLETWLDNVSRETVNSIYNIFNIFNISGEYLMFCWSVEDPDKDPTWILGSLDSSLARFCNLHFSRLLYFLSSLLFVFLLVKLCGHDIISHMYWSFGMVTMKARSWRTWNELHVGGIWRWVFASHHAYDFGCLLLPRLLLQLVMWWCFTVHFPQGACVTVRLRCRKFWSSVLKPCIEAFHQNSDQEGCPPFRSLAQRLHFLTLHVVGSCSAEEANDESKSPTPEVGKKAWREPQLCKLSCCSRGCSSRLPGQEQISLQPAGRSRWGSCEVRSGKEKWSLWKSLGWFHNQQDMNVCNT